jgi:hypothetical protein
MQKINYGNRPKPSDSRSSFQSFGTQKKNYPRGSAGLKKLHSKYSKSGKKTMKLPVTKQGVTIPREFFEGIEEVELRREKGWIAIVPSQLSKKPRVLGIHPGAIVMSQDFDEPLPDEFWLGNL